MWLNLKRRRKNLKLLLEADIESVRKVPGTGNGLTFRDIFKLFIEVEGGGGDVGYFIFQSTGPGTKYSRNYGTLIKCRKQTRQHSAFTNHNMKIRLSLSHRISCARKISHFNDQVNGSLIAIA